MTTVAMYQPSHGDKNMYYILTENHPYGSKFFPAGSMCYLSEQSYLRCIRLSPTRFLRVVMEQDGSVVTVDAEILQPLPDKMADYLSAISNIHERLNCFLNRHVLDAAMNAKQGQRIFVELDHQTFSGTICYIGKVHRSPLPSGLCPVYFGVELQGDGEGKGHCDGTYNGTEYFKCKKDCGLFLPCNKLQFVSAPEMGMAKQEANPDAVGGISSESGGYHRLLLDDAFMRGNSNGCIQGGKHLDG
uniref:ubiquitin carboxyl-terminal hydrolase CYLD-like n=1 Tax=Podarcis muralis TaxID=64176 RepID=UPI00109F9AD3|nr:ubiquitin carboxyl-terminal hydrolase CYLD-like [Podarcis muralis]